MSATNAFETDLLELIFQNISSPNIGDATGLVGSSAAGNFWISLHTLVTGLEAAASSQSTDEASYTGYARISVPRTSGSTGWTVSGNTMDNATAITFGTGASAAQTQTAFGIGTTLTGEGYLCLYGTLTSPLTVSTGIVPQFAAGALDVTLD
jgi:hypothetical protein